MLLLCELWAGKNVGRTLLSDSVGVGFGPDFVSDFALALLSFCSCLWVAQRFTAAFNAVFDPRL
jgi:hypothetical protein